MSSSKISNRIMKTNLLFFGFPVILFSSICVSAQAKKIQSVYTNLDIKSCKTLESSVDEGGWYLGECRGIGGYRLQITEGDIRQSINVIAPNKKKFELDFYRNVSAAFSSVGAKAEWRVVRSKGKTVTPMALIVRYYVSENPDDSSILTSYLVVSKITKNEICITNVVKSSANANTKARKLADASAIEPCKVSDN